MAFVASKKSRLLVGDFHLAAYATQVGSQWQQAMLDSTVLTDTAKAFTPDQHESTLTVQGLYDTAEHADLAAWKSAAAQPVSFGPSGFALGSELWMVNALLSEFSLGSAIGGMGSFGLTAQTDGLTDFGVSLHDLTAVTADESGTGHDGAAATALGGSVHLHVTAFSGFSGAVVIVEDSANNSDWATIATFTTVAAVTAERQAVAGTIRRYTRYSVDVTGTGSITFQVGLARRP